MNYLEIHIDSPAELAEILVAELSEADFDSFMEIEEGLIAYVEENKYNEGALLEIMNKYFDAPSFKVSKMEEKNWNAEWEKNFEPVIVDDKVALKASFHQLDKQYPLEIIINPKMSFGTGHHETTYMMIQNQLGIDHNNKKVMDAGTGTGILAILSCKLGASSIFAFDIEDWAFENLKENINLNGCENIIVGQGTCESLDSPFSFYDIVLANINKNVLIHEIPLYSKFLQKGGFLVISGFYEEDIADIQKITSKASLDVVKKNTNNKWASLVLQKN